MYFNIHTHNKPSAHQWAILNVLKDFDDIPGSGVFSAGLHPWYLNEKSLAEELKQLSLALQKGNVLALGECGLDKVCNTDYQLQQQCFRQQVLLANEYRKPLILHCVKAFDDVTGILKESKASVPVIFHGYHKSRELALQLVKKGYYISFGKHILQEATAGVFHSIPLNHVFLETDGADVKIDEIYGKAAAIKEITEQELQQQLALNVESVFGKTFI